MTLLNIEKY